MIEAFHARVPLIVLTADRPPELREVGAGQAIDQLKLYGDAVKWFFEVGVDDATPDTLRWIRQLACRAYWTALGGPARAGAPQLPAARAAGARRAAARAIPVPGPRRRPPVGAARVRRRRDGRRPPPRRAPPGPRGVVVAGRDERDAGLGAAAARFAERAGYPLLADPLSGARHGATAIATYDLLLRDPAFTAAVAPELVDPGRRPAHLQAAAGLAGVARRAPSSSRSTPRRPGRTRPRR